MKSRIAAIIPALNEAGSIAQVVEGLRGSVEASVHVMSVKTSFALSTSPTLVRGNVGSQHLSPASAASRARSSGEAVVFRASRPARIIAAINSRLAIVDHIRRFCLARLTIY